MDKPKFEDIECEQIKQYCPWEGLAISSTGMCEGRFCVKAYERYIEELKGEE